MKLGDVTQWVRLKRPIPPDKRLASRSVTTSTCQPSNGRTKLEEVSRQAASLRPEIGRVVVKRIASAVSRAKPTVCLRRKAAILGAIGASAQDTPGVEERGMSAEGELGNLGEPPGSAHNSRDGGPGDQKPWRDLGASTRS